MNFSRLGAQIKKDVLWLKDSGLERDDVMVEDLPSPETVINGQKLISFCSNNYFGLSKRPEVLHAAQSAMFKYGIGTCESRRLGGDLSLLEELEGRIARFKHGTSAVTFATGLLTNIGAVSALVDTGFYCDLFWGSRKREEGNDSLILFDKKSHRSIQMGAKLAHAESMTYAHCDMQDLQEKLERHSGQRNILIVTDGVFSMDGNLAPLDEIVRLAERYNAMVMVDDAHGTGIYGKTGRGTAEHFGVLEKIHVHMGTFSKTFGALGGFIVTEKEIADAIKYTSSAYYFTSGLPAEQAAGIIAAIDIVENEPRLRHKLWENSQEIILGIKSIGLSIPDRWSHIVPIIINDEGLAEKAEIFLREKGILCSSVHPPAVKPGEDRLRITVNSTHSVQHIAQLLSALADMAERLNLPRNPQSAEETFASLGPLPEVG